jgi:hypothetical protein
MQPVVAVYRVPLAKWGPLRGAHASAAGASASLVPSLGEAPAGWSRFPVVMRWSAALRLPYFGNFSFRSAGRVEVDGREILRAEAGKPPAEATVSLPRGDHRVLLEGAVEAPGRPVLFEWKGDEPGEPWRRTVASELWAVDGPPQGLLGVFTSPRGSDRKSLDSTIAAMSLNQEVGLNEDWTASWRGALLAPVDGATFSDFAPTAARWRWGSTARRFGRPEAPKRRPNAAEPSRSRRGPTRSRFSIESRRVPVGSNGSGRLGGTRIARAARGVASAGRRGPRAAAVRSVARRCAPYRHASLATVAP